MGFRFSLEHANWLAHILQPTGTTPRLENGFEEEEALRAFLQTFERNFYPSRAASLDAWNRLRSVLLARGSTSNLERAVRELASHFSDIPWVALLLPSGSDHASDRLLTNGRFLRSLVDRHPDEAGWILQLQEPPREEIVLQDVFPAFKTALADFTRWPGVLFWTATESIFLELTRSPKEIETRLDWLFWQLDGADRPNLGELKQGFNLEFDNDLFRQRRFHVLHVSDTHLGSRVARSRMPRVQTILRSVVDELSDDRIVPVVTGDLMDTPSEDNLAEVRSFLDFLEGLRGECPIVTLGNHDVRQDGWLNPQFRQAVNLPNAPVIWFDEDEVAIACFNSVNGGRLARGKIGQEEMAQVGNALDRQSEKRHYTLLAALHHHPIPVERPDWYRQRWYERVLGNFFESTEELEDAQAFLRWLELRGASAALHGHKHIPRFCMHENIAIIGCGSSTGKVDTIDAGQTYLSLNIVTLDRERNSLSCRLRAERVLGGGLEGIESHEMVLRGVLH